ncbi:YbaB/EbfC family nucleoid-associated protein [Amycolatopsis sp. NBC_00345]|uniref:YbaB/EbfC family nucleoid-associated protein n=1 Tax=Amycolatopsis sp. NBC_00345 TaxID=2975955 RepID=UPI002E252CBA
MSPAAPPPDRDSLVTALSTLSADVTSPDGAAGVSVNTDGVLTALHLSDAVRGMSPQEIAELVLLTYAEAQRVSARRTGELLAPLGTTGYLMDRLRWRAGFSPEIPENEPADGASGSAAEGSHAAGASAPESASTVPGEYLRDRSADAVPEPSEPGPVADDDWYDTGVRFDPAW